MQATMQKPFYHAFTTFTDILQIGKRLRDAVLFYLPLSSTFALKKKTAPPNLPYPLIVEDYKHHLRSFPDSYLSFQSFCELYNVRVESVRQWMRRRGIDLSVLYYEVLLKRSTSAPAFEIPQTFYGRRKTSRPPAEQEPAAVQVVSSPEVLKGVSITFPDGVTVNIRQAHATALTKFIESYNKLSTQSYVQSE